MRTKMECRSLGEERSTFATNSSVRQMKQNDTTGKKMKSKKSSSGNGAVALGLLAGAAAGALAGVLLAPDKGTTTRKKVADSASKLGDQVSKGYTSTKSKVDSWTGKKKEPYINPNLSKNQQAQTGNVQSSPYTDKAKWDDDEVNRMINDSRKTPGL
ncbi:YtxH domain-containing protein [uncultured Pontibacter sp.]|uniref:YtxH domain-containing protein n=1 Tax=uncultured Pontibacter sp. TaxID=453356 RepID=UPI00261FC56F|nr:YtxH domain-containing protein [uncultured Pontibacter sp.]